MTSLASKMATISEEVVLEGEFFLYPKKKGLYKLTLTRHRLFFSPISNNSTTYEEQIIQISDIVGCHCLEKGGNVILAGAAMTGSNEPNKTSSSLLEADNYEPLEFPGQNFFKVSDPATCGIVIYAYPFKRKRFSSKRTRCRQVIAFEVPSSPLEVFEERKKEALKWKTVMNILTRDISNSSVDISNWVLQPRGKLLILINPHSGPGKAYVIFKNEIAPMLFEADIPYKAIITDHAGHASELLKEINLSDWYGVVIVSGDGLIFETINGIMQRDDWASSINMPIGCLPGGSGNALCCAINYAAGQPLDSSMVLHSTFILVKHKVIPMDLVIVQIPDNTIFSFLSVTWGIMADIDYESEKYRNLGEARFTIGAIKRILSLRTYRGRISFLPVAEYNPQDLSNSKKVLTKIRRFSLRSRSSSKSTNDSASRTSNSPRMLTKRCYSMDNSGYSEHQLRMAEGDTTQVQADEALNIHNGKLELGQGEEQESMQKLCAGLTVTENKQFTACAEANVEGAATANGLENSIELPHNKYNHGGDETYEEQYKMTILSETQEVNVEEETYHGKKSDFGPVPTPLLTPLDKEVPENWVKVEGEFILVAAVYQTHLGSDMLAAPDAHLNDGHIHLMIVREGISRNALLNLFLSFGQGSHVHSPYVESVKVLAFRLEPETSNGNIMIDGERFDPSPLQAQILPGLARVMAIK
ncbi:unnamed protein product [Lymnaea stagnalis]|uniref:DAGKc domain-containing protein n=1 Tax=Lymnaea stagnalis TaxID=6523 RepID=A0AAV2HB46_LYMST